MRIYKKFLTLHPQGKAGANISKQKYDQVQQAIIQVLDEQGDMTFAQLGERVSDEIESEFDGSVSWYCNYGET